ncbi:MAG TPA: FAD binding domain-containing protein [Spirochaetia bacterium]|nr:FAD binding domain-containing protein [Spirochaetia bacterium]
MKEHSARFEPKWYFPGTLREASALLEKTGVVPHGGGTMILRGNSSRIKGLIDLSALPLRFFRERKRELEIGSIRTYTEVVESLQKAHPDHILVKALCSAASTPLRNRITLGGSIAFFPLWSDLMGPLIALEALVTLSGSNPGAYPVTELVKSRKLIRGNLITGVRLKNDPWQSAYHRETRTHFDYPAFTLTVLAKITARKVRDARIVFVGNTEKYKRLTSLEEYLTDSAPAEARKMIDQGDLAPYLDLAFSGKKLGSPEYIRHLAATRLKRLLSAVLTGEDG